MKLKCSKCGARTEKLMHLDGSNQGICRTCLPVKVHDTSYIYKNCLNCQTLLKQIDELKGIIRNMELVKR